MLKVLYNSCGNGPGYVPASEDGASSKLQGESWLKLAAYLAGVRLQCFTWRTSCRNGPEGIGKDTG